MRRFVVLWLAVSLGAACGGDDDGTNPTPDAGPVVLDPPPPPGGQQLTSGEYTVPSGTEKYFCFTFRSPADEKAITRVQPIQGDVVHHVALFQTTTPEPEGTFECPEIVRVNWQPIWAGGAGASPLDLPEGVGFKIAPNTQYLVQYHLNNPTDQDVTERSAINLTYAPDASTITAAGLWGMGSFNLSIPAGAVDFQQVSECTVDRELNVFAIFPHMHRLGNWASVDTGATMDVAAEVYRKDPWVFGDQPMDPVQLTIQPGDYLRATCSWDNPGASPVVFGESSDDEMCFVVLFYYPFTELAGCVN